VSRFERLLVALFGAGRFLTIVPLPGGVPARAFGAAAFPVVGLAIGAAVAIADVVFEEIVPFELRNIAVVAFLAVVTGGLHYDGLADSLDAFGGRDRAERLRIMADGSIGTFAVLGLMLALATRISALTLLDEPARVPALILAPALGRAAMVFTAWRAPAAKPDGLGATFLAELETRDVMVAGACAAVAALVLSGELGIVAFVGVGVIAATLRSVATRSFGGVTGDVLGASGEIVETAMLALFAIGRGA